MAWVGLAAVAAAFLGPIAALIGRLDLASARDIATSPSFLKAMEVTLLSASIGAMAAVAIAVGFARAFALNEWRGKRVQRLLLLMPYLVPNFVLAVAYTVAWNPGSGLLNGVLRFPLGLYGLWGMTFTFAVAYMPVAFLLLEDKFRRVDPALREAARLAGAGPWAILFRVELPLVLPTLTSAFALCFALCISAFAIPAWIGAPEHAYPLTYKIYQAIQVGGVDGIPEAAGYSLVLLVLALPPLALARYAQSIERRTASLTGKASRREERARNPRSFAMFQALYWFSQLVFWVAPLACLFATTWVAPGCLQSNGLSCLAHLTGRSYSYVLFQLPDTRAGLYGSLVYGGLSSAIVIGLAVASLALFARSRARSTAAEWVFSVPVATPGAVIALGLIVAASGRYGINLYNTAWIVVVAYVVKHLNLAYQPLRTGLGAISGSLHEAARLSGARPAQVWRRIVLPILRPELLGAFFLVFIPILGELTMTVFLASPSMRSIGTVVFDLQDYADQTSAAALSILLVALVLVMNESARLLSRGRLGY